MEKEKKNNNKMNSNKRKEEKSKNRKEKVIEAKVEELEKEEPTTEEEFDEDLEDLIEDEKEITKPEEKKNKKKHNNKSNKEEKVKETIEEEIDEDLEDLIEDEKEITKPEEKVVIEKKEKFEKKKHDEKINKNNIEKIEKKVKEKSKKKNPNSKLSKFLLLLDKYRYPIYTFIAGVLLTIFVAILIWPDRIATLKDGTQPIVKVGGKTYTADKLYENMKNYYSVSLLLDEIDNDLLTKMYPEDETMTKKVQENAEYYLNMYKQYYNYTQEQFLEKNGFSSYEAFLNYLRLDYRRNKYLDEYVEKNITDEEIEKYYTENVFGDINTQHILVEVKTNDEDKSKLSDEDAKKLAEEIITKINDGTDWSKIKEEYKDKITFEDLGYQSWDASLEQSFMTALKEMEDNSFSKEPVKTSYGYHVIYRLDQKKKPTLKKSKDKIIEKISTEKKSKDSNLLYKSLISLRNEKKIKFSDSVMKSKYETYCKQYK